MVTQRIWGSPISWFVMAAVLLFAIGVHVSAVLEMGDTALDIPIHDTYLVIAHEHLVLATALFCIGCATIYWAFSRVLQRRSNRTLGLIHAAFTFIGLQCIYLPLHLMGATAAPRRNYSYTSFEPVDGSGGMLDINMTVTVLAAVFLIGQVIMLVNVIRTLARPPEA